VLAYQARRIYATIGRSGRSGEPIVSKPSEKRYGRSPRPVRLYTINVDDAKADVMNSLTLAAPGPGYMHFPELVDEEYFAQLCAEHRETKYNQGGVAVAQVWVQDRERNEALDTAVLALAAHRLLNPNIRQVGELLAQAAAAKRSGQPTPPISSAPGQPAVPGRRMARSGYLQG
jgi:phage terminase large subunit GpA-like protein